MLTQPTIEKLCAMRLRGMAEAFEQQQQDAHIHSLSFEERLGLLIDRQWNWRLEFLHFLPRMFWSLSKATSVFSPKSRSVYCDLH